MSIKFFVVFDSALMAAHGVYWEPLRADLERLQNEGKTVMIVAMNGEAAGLIAVANTVKLTSAESIEALHRMGMRVVMLTDDNWRTAKAIARQVGLNPDTEVAAEVLPDGKAEAVGLEQGAGGKGQGETYQSKIQNRRDGG